MNSNESNIEGKEDDFGPSRTTDRAAHPLAAREAPRLHEESRQQLRLLAELRGYIFHAHESVYPSPTYRQYPTVFMSAMHPNLAWLYQGDIPENIQTSLCTSFCIRSNNNFRNAGRSSQNLKCFEMLSISGRMPEKELLENVHCLLSNQLEGSGAVLSMHLHPDDIVAKEFCREHSLEFDEDRASIFIEPDKTDRIGMKVEWFATKNAGDKIQRVELMDTLTIYSCNHGSDRIDPPLVESGGSFERLLALREGVDHVQLSSAFDVAGMQKVAEAAQYEIKLEQALVLQDLIRPIVIMAGSGFCLPESHKKGTKQEKAFYSACHELVLSALEMQLPASLLPRLIEHDVRYLKHWKSAGYDFAKLEVTMPAQSITSVSESLQARYDSTLRYMRQNRGKWADEELVRRAANLYFGGATRLAILALQDIG